MKSLAVLVLIIGAGRAKPSFGKLYKLALEAFPPYSFEKEMPGDPNLMLDQWKLSDVNWPSVSRASPISGNQPLSILEIRHFLDFIVHWRVLRWR
jgi:hypothetical protein